MEFMELVVLLHGMLRTKRSMSSVEKILQKQGYATLNITYPSSKLSIEQIVEFIHEIISVHKAYKKIHFIGYSLGGLVIRAYLHKHKLSNLGKVVMVGTPNQGSESADKFKHMWLFKKLIGPAGQQLGTDQDKFKHIFGKVYYELGVIAGSAAIDPINYMIIPKPNDGKVSVESTKIKGMTDHIVIKTNHTFMIRSTRVLKQILSFLQRSKFDHA